MIKFFTATRGATIAELMIAGTMMFVALLPLGYAYTFFTQHQEFQGGRLDSKVRALQIVTFISNVGRYASECLNNLETAAPNDPVTLDCTVDFGSGNERVLFTYVPDTQTLRYERGPASGALREIWEATSIENFFTCSGNQIAARICPDGDAAWNGSIFAANPGDLSAFFRVNLVARLVYKKAGVETNAGDNFAAHGSFFSRNTASGTTVKYRWSPTGGL